MNHKKLLIGCGCALLAIALVVCLVLVIGNVTVVKSEQKKTNINTTTKQRSPAETPPGLLFAFLKEKVSRLSQPDGSLGFKV